VITLDLVEINTMDWTPHENTPTNRSWYVGGDPFRFRLIDQLGLTRFRGHCVR
jgi:hypothetical protein